MFPVSTHAPKGDQDEGFDLVVIGEFADSVIHLIQKVITYLLRRV